MDTTKKVEANISDEYKHKNPQQNIIKLCSTTHKDQTP